MNTPHFALRLTLTSLWPLLRVRSSISNRDEPSNLNSAQTASRFGRQTITLTIRTGACGSTTQESGDVDATDLVVTVGLSTDPWPMVKAYIEREKILHVYRLSAVPAQGTGASSVQCGRHAVALADDLVNQVSLLRASGRFSGRVHLFMAVPNGFSFFLGQRISRLGQVTLYEFDFEGARGNTYEPSLNLPVLVTSLA